MLRALGDARAAPRGMIEIARRTGRRGRTSTRREGEPRAALMLGHGAGGGFKARDLQAVTAVARELGYLRRARRAALPRRGPPLAPRPPTSSTPPGSRSSSTCASDELAGLPLVAGGRSSGARVACRTAAAADAIAVLCLAFPVHPPGKPEKTRLDELDGVEVPVLVIQGESDPFGMPPHAPGREVVVVPGTHSFTRAATRRPRGRARVPAAALGNP